MPSGHLSGQGGYVQGGFVLNFWFKKYYTFLKILGVVVGGGRGLGCVVRVLTPSEPPPSIIKQRITFYKVLIKWVMYCLQSAVEIDITCILVFRFTTRIRRQTILIFCHNFRTIQRELMNQVTILFSLSTRKSE